MNENCKIGNVDVSILNLESLVEQFLDLRDHPWRAFVEIIPKYMPPYPSLDTKPTCQIRFRYNEHCRYLRYSKGPGMGCFWDIYGDDFLTPELAFRAILFAPCPHPVVFFEGINKL